MSKVKHRKKRHLKKWVKVLALILIFVPCFIFAKDVYAEYYPFSHITCLEQKDMDVHYDAIEKTFLDEQNQQLEKHSFKVQTNDHETHMMYSDENGKILTGVKQIDGEYYLLDENGYRVDHSVEIGGVSYKVHKNGKLFHQEWQEKKWFDKGVAVATKEDMLLFVKGETGFYYLDSKKDGARIVNGSVVLKDGREVRFDENGHIVANEVYDGNVYYFPVCEVEETAKETKWIAASSYVHEESFSGIRLINHRGYHVNAPENTLAAFQESKKNKYQFVETDVQMTSDNVPVLLHNATLRAMAGVNVAINSISESEAKQYSFSGQQITTLDEFIAYCKANQITPYIELKTETISNSEQIQMIYDIVKKYDMCGKVEWISFSVNLLEMLGNIDDSVPFGYVVGVKDDAQFVMQRALEMKNNGMHVFIDAHYQAQSAYLSFCKENDVPLELWGINSQSDLDNVDAYVSGVTTDTLLNQ